MPRTALVRVVMKTARRLAHGDASRIRIVDASTVVVGN
jgi:hypothetical protein